MQRDYARELTTFQYILDKIDSIEAEIQQLRHLINQLLQESENVREGDHTEVETVDQLSTISDLTNNLAAATINNNNNSIHHIDSNTQPRNNTETLLLEQLRNPNLLTDSAGVVLRIDDRVRFTSTRWPTTRGRIVNITETRVTVQIRNGQRVVFGPNSLTIHGRSNE